MVLFDFSTQKNVVELENWLIETDSPNGEKKVTKIQLVSCRRSIETTSLSFLSFLVSFLALKH